jgi:hypothetical protein
MKRANNAWRTFWESWHFGANRSLDAETREHATNQAARKMRVDCRLLGRICRRGKVLKPAECIVVQYINALQQGDAQGFQASDSDELLAEEEEEWDA